MRTRTLAGAAAALALVAVAATPAAAYVRARTDKGVAVYWPGSCVYMQPDAAGTPDLPADQTFGAIQKAISNWNTALTGHAYQQLKYDTPAPLEAHLDGVNTVKFRTDRWCHPDDAQVKDLCYPDVAAGITTVFFVQDGHSNAGAIEDTDIELNDINFQFVIEPNEGTLTGGRSPADLENTVTHELGHVLGLDHPCKPPTTLPQEVDDQGNPPPDCNAIPPAEVEKITTATMYPTYTRGEISKRMPKADDVNGVAEAYPPAKDPKVCKHTNLNDYGGGCAIVPGHGAPLTVLVLVGLALVALVARRRHG
jgi:hypothetical protein